MRRKLATVLSIVLLAVLVSEATTEKETFVEDLLEEYRQVLVTYHLDFDSVFPKRGWKTFDQNRLEMFPTKEAWPNVLGHVDEKADAFKVHHETSLMTNEVSGGRAFAAPLKGNLTTDAYATLLFSEGISSEASVVLKSYASLVCQGEMAGNLFFRSYATAYVKGDLTGRVACMSYFNLIVTGKFSGSLLAESYAMIYLLGGWNGTLELDNSKVYIAGRTAKADLERIKGQGMVYLEESDLPPGEHQVGALKVTVPKTLSPTGK